MKTINKVKPTICILGGMGPQASARLLSVVVQMAACDFGTENDTFPEIVVDSIPVPDFISNTRNKAKALKMLRERIKIMNLFNPTCFAVACNTAHIMLDDLQVFAKSPFISLIDEVSRQVKKARIKKVGLLATPMTLRSELYQVALKKLGIRVVIPNTDELIELESVIRRVIAGTDTFRDAQILESITRSLNMLGARGIILGCTELPLIFPKDFSLPVFDSIDILARALLATSYQERRKGGS